MADTPAVAPREGERIGPYCLESPIGSGGMGTVWRAWDERLRRHVAVKWVLRNPTARSRERLRREARAAARLSHPAIVHIYDLLEGDAADWIVMELVSGETLRRLLDRKGGLELGQALQLGRQIAEGLAEAHGQGILHRDLKAANIMVTASGRAKILDFGLAKELQGEGTGTAGVDPGLSTPGALLGTYFAMSPEQVLGLDLDARSDLFSFGSLLYEILTGGAPFRGEEARVTLARVLHFQPRPLHEVRPDVSRGLSRLIERLLEKDIQNRPASAAEVCQALESLTVVRPMDRAGSAESATLETAVQTKPSKSGHGSRASSGSTVGGERRTVTVVCCTLVRNDAAGSLDLEVLSDSMVMFESVARAVCSELGGSLGAVFSRTLWLCFGYPQAHEDDAERAVRAAREIQERFAALPLSVAHRLAVRAGVHTGPAVVVNRPSLSETLQPGETVEIALAIQSRVPAGRIAVSAVSRQLLWRKFVTQPLPAMHLQDLDETVAVYELGPQLEPGNTEGGRLLPLVNRDAELQILLDRFRLACSGLGQAVMIAGEAGIGKSRLVRALAEQVAADAPTWLTAHGSAFAQNTPLAPIIHLLERTLFGVEGSAEEKLRRLEEALDSYNLPRPDHVPLLGALLSLPIEGRYRALVLSPEAQRKRTLAAILTLLGSLAERHPMVLVIEDLHWIDPSTLELLDLLLGELPMLPLLVVATFRPEFAASLRHQASVTLLGLSGLSESHTAQLVRQVAEGRGLPVEMHQEIVQRTDGIPLFVEELTKAVLEVEESHPGVEGIPLTLGSSLLARLDRLGEAKAVAQLAAVIGRTFSLELLQALSGIEGAALQGALGRLLQAEILQRRGPAQRARYMFRHALFQDAAYLSLLASDRQQLHLQLARLLQGDFPVIAEAEPELMAHHCERGGWTEQAIEYLQAAGLRALQRSAHLEALSHLSRALDLLPGLPSAPEQVMKELALRSRLTPALAATRGWGAPEVAVNAERCVALCRTFGDRSRLIPSLYALWTHYLLRGDRQPSIDLADEIARLAETPVQIYIGCSARAYTTYYSGRFAEALALCEQATALYEPGMLQELASFGLESSLMPHVYKCWALWNLGEPDMAARKRDAVHAVVETLRSPFVLGMALVSEMTLGHNLRRDPEWLDELAERLMKLAREQEFAFLYAAAQCGKGWAVCQRGDLPGGTVLIRTGLDLYAATGARLSMGFWDSFLVQACLAAGRLDEGLTIVREALARSETRLDVFFDTELARLEGELLRAAGDAQAAEASFRKALEVASRQGARTLKLRTATSLGRLLEEQGRDDEALPVLAAIYDTFREGFATRDLLEARELLDRLTSRVSATIPAS